MAVSSVGLRLKCDCSGKAQKQFNGKLQTRFLVRKDALKAERRNCQTKEEQDKIWSRVPKGGPIPRRTGRLTAGRKKNSNSNSCNYRNMSLFCILSFCNTLPQIQKCLRNQSAGPRNLLGAFSLPLPANIINTSLEAWSLCLNNGYPDSAVPWFCSVLSVRQIRPRVCLK
jgi:hypothetical protein